MSFLLSFLVASLLGTLAGLGLGGGSLLIVYLTAILNMSPETARGLNLLFFLPASLIATLLRIRKGNFPIKKAIPAILAGIMGSILFSYIGTHMDTAVLRRLFGVLLLITGVRELFYRERKIK